MAILKFFHDLPWPLAMVIVLILCQPIAWLVLYISRKWRNDRLFAHNEQLLSIMLSFVTLIFGIQVSFIIVLEQTWINTGITATQEEAAALGNMLRDAEEFIPWDKEIKESILTYIKYLVNEEWKFFEEGKELSLESDQLVSKIWQAYHQLPLNLEKTKLWYGNALDDLDAFLKARSHRIVSAESSLHPMLWTWILLLGIISLILVSLLPIKKFSLDMFLLSLYTSIIGMVLYLTFALNHPFEGQVKVSSSPYQKLLKKYDVAS